MDRELKMKIADAIKKLTDVAEVHQNSLKDLVGVVKILNKKVEELERKLQG